MPDVVHSLATNCKLYQTNTAGGSEGLNTQGGESKFSGVKLAVLTISMNGLHPDTNLTLTLLHSSSTLDVT